MDVDTYSSETI